MKQKSWKRRISCVSLSLFDPKLHIHSLFSLHIQWPTPYYRILISMLKAKYSNKYDIVVAPGPKEIEESKLLNTKIILNKGKALKINELISLIKDSSFIISNDTGPAHICSHMNKAGIVLFGGHTSAHKVSIETEKFKPISVQNLNLLKAETIMEEIKKILN